MLKVTKRIIKPKKQLTNEDLLRLTFAHLIKAKECLEKSDKKTKDKTILIQNVYAVMKEKIDYCIYNAFALCELDKIKNGKDKLYQIRPEEAENENNNKC